MIARPDPTAPTALGQSDAAEVALLAACLGSADAIATARESRIRPEDFAAAGWGHVWRTILGMDDRGAPVDRVTLSAELQRGGWAAADAERTTALLDDNWIGDANTAAHAALVREYAHRRGIATVGQQLAGAANDRAVDVRDLIEHAERTIHALRPEHGRTVQRVGTVAREVLAAHDHAKAHGVPPGTSFGFANLDAMTGGMRPGQLWVVAARPGVGKSILARQIAIRVATGGTRVLGVTLEMSAAEQVLRALAEASGVPAWAIEQGRTWDSQIAALAKAVDWLDTLPMAWDDSADLTVGELRARARRLNKRDRAPLGLIVVDYLQLLDAGLGDRATTNDRTSHISRHLKLMAKELACPVLALSQLNRASARESREPDLPDLRDSGAIEQDADGVVFLHQPDPQVPRVEAILRKLRNGKVPNRCALWRDGDTVSFHEVAA